MHHRHNPRHQNISVIEICIHLLSGTETDVCIINEINHIIYLVTIYLVFVVNLYVVLIIL